MTPNLPNLSLLNYHVWSAIKKAACTIHHSSVDAMKRSVEEHWAKIPTNTLKKVCSKFCSRVGAASPLRATSLKSSQSRYALVLSMQ